jgi:two-component system chemotaxis response regulator CheY
MSRRALVVDDSTSMRQMVGYTLTEAGFEVREGANGKEGLDRLDAGPVELIITDFNMPVMDGLAFIRAVRAKPAFKFTPILMLTTEAGDARKQEGKAAGATGWIVKPFDPAKLLQIVAKVLP